MNARWVQISGDQAICLARCLYGAERFLHYGLECDWLFIQQFYRETYLDVFSEGLSILNAALPPVDDSDQHFAWDKVGRLSFFRILSRRIFAGWYKQWYFRQEELRLFRWQLQHFCELMSTNAKPENAVLIADRMTFFDCQQLLDLRCYEGMRGLDRTDLDDFWKEAARKKTERFHAKV